MDTDEILDVEAVVAEARIAEARIATETREKAAVTAIEMPETTATASATATTETTFSPSPTPNVGGDGDDARATFAASSRTSEKPNRREETNRRVGVVPGPPPGAFAGDDAARAAGLFRGGDGGDARAANLSAARATPPGCFPPTFLAAGCADTTVPWFESAEFHWALRDADVPSRVLLYLKEPHASFVLGWSPRPSRSATEKRRANEANAEENDAKARFPAAAAAAASVSTAAVSATTVSAASTGGSAFANAFESDAADRRGDAGGVNAWNDGYDGEEEEHGLSAHCRDILRVIKHA